MKKLLLPLVFTLFVSCSSIAGFVQSCIDRPVPVEVDNSPKGKVTSSLFTAAHIGSVGGFIIAVLAGVASVTVPSKRLAGLSFIAALIGSVCLLCVFILPYLNYIVYGALVAVSAWGGYQLYKRHHEGVESKQKDQALEDLSKGFHLSDGYEVLGHQAKKQLEKWSTDNREKIFKEINEVKG